jgi:hypothetical protein
VFNLPSSVDKRRDWRCGQGIECSPSKLTYARHPPQDRVKTNIKKLNEGKDAKSAAASAKAGEAPKKPSGLSPFESMLYTNLSGAIVALVFCALTGQIATGLAFCQRSEVAMPAASRPPSTAVRLHCSDGGSFPVTCAVSCRRLSSRHHRCDRRGRVSSPPQSVAPAALST